MHKGLCRSVALAAVLALTDIAAAETWKFATVRRAPDVVATFDEEFVSSVNNAAQGSVVAEMQSITNEQEMIQQVVRGRLEMGVTSPLGIAGLIPDIAVLNIPYLWLSNEERDYVYEKHLVAHIEEMFDEKGLVLLGVQEAGYNGVFCKLDCSDPAALNGQKVRVSPSASGRMFWESIGAIPVQLPLSELWPGLDQGLVIAGDLPIGFYSTSPGASVAKHFVYTDHIHSPWLYFANKAVWERLPQEVRENVLKGVPSIFSTSARFFEEQEKRADAFVEKGGVVYALTDEEKLAWAGRVAPNIAPFTSEMSERARKVYEVISQAKTEFRSGNR